MLLTLTHQQLPGAIVIALAGEVDRTNSAQLADYVARVRQSGHHVVFDLAELSFLDSSGLHVVLGCARECAEEGVGLHLAGSRGAPARLFAITGVDKRIPMHATAEQAITTILSARGNV